MELRKENAVAYALAHMPNEVIRNTYTQRAKISDPRIEATPELVDSALLSTPGNQRCLPVIEQRDGSQGFNQGPHLLLDAGIDVGHDPANAVGLVDLL